MNHWQIVEAFIDEYQLDDGTFAHSDLVALTGLGRKQATDALQQYVKAQRAGRTVRMIRRVGSQTRTARWAVGARAADMQGRRDQFSADLIAKIEQAVVPDFEAYYQHSPRSKAKYGEFNRELGRILAALHDG